MARDRVTADRPHRDVRAASLMPLWIGFLAGPIIWSLHLVVSLVVLSAACSTGSNGFSTFMLFGAAGWRVVMLLITLLLALLTLGADLIAVRTWRETRI